MPTNTTPCVPSDVHSHNTCPRQRNPTWEGSEAVQDELVSIREKGRVEMIDQDSRAWVHAVAVQSVSCSQANGLHVPRCKFTHRPAPAHSEAKTALNFSIQMSRHREIETTWPVNSFAARNLRILKVKNQSTCSPSHQLSPDLQLSEEDNV